MSYIKNKEHLIEELEKALQRMKDKGRKGTYYYNRLKSKKKAVENGREYKIKDGKLELAKLIGQVGAKIPNANKGFGGNDNLKKGGINSKELEKSAKEILDS